uniref:(California timema) hypothetical protein n=1 Tax=Timema californicum TaxID=61474 RepID=A0A7R9P5M9_TIMCA|nr:unnamed protein product [Timema californicum]
MTGRSRFKSRSGVLRVIHLSTNYANGLGTGKVEFKGSEPAFAWRESEKPVRKHHPSSRKHKLDSNLDLPVLGSRAQHETSALANYTTKSTGKRNCDDCRILAGETVTIVEYQQEKL